MNQYLLALFFVACLGSGMSSEISVRIEDRTYPVQESKMTKWQPVEKLLGKSTYTTHAIILENEYLALTVLPEFAGRLIEVREKVSGHDLFWRHDVLLDRGPGRMGGCHWSFPFWEHGRHFDETTGYVIIRRDDGSVTLAMDLRFDAFLKPEETVRYGRATNLRLVQTISLRPSTSRLTWSARVENPLPIRCGFNLWWLMRQDAVAGTNVLMPAAAVTGHGAPSLVPWDWSTIIKTGQQNSLFAVGIRNDFAGWYRPDLDLNILRLQDHRVAPGAKQVIYQPNPNGYIEMWGGNHELFEECGRLLPAFGSYENSLEIIPAVGIGKAEYANRHAVVSCARTPAGWAISLVPTTPLAGAKITVSSGSDTISIPCTAAPDRPGRVTLQTTAERVRVRLFASDGAPLLDQQLPIEPGPMPETEFAALQARVRHDMPGGKSLSAETIDLVTEHLANLQRTAADNAAVLATANDPQILIDAGRQLMRARRDAPEALAAFEKVLGQQPTDSHAHLYAAMWLWEKNRFEEATAHLAQATSLPGARFLLALRAVAAKNYTTAERHLEELLLMPPSATFRGEGDPGLALLQPSAVISATRPRLLLAIALEADGRPEAAEKVLRSLVDQDPALIEAWMLLGDAQRLATLTDRNPAGKSAAERVLRDLRAGVWSGIGRP